MRPEGPRSITINHAPIIIPHPDSSGVDGYRAPLGRTNFFAGRLPSPLGWAEGFRAVGPNTNVQTPVRGVNPAAKNPRSFGAFPSRIAVQPDDKQTRQRLLIGDVGKNRPVLYWALPWLLPSEPRIFCAEAGSFLRHPRPFAPAHDLTLLDATPDRVWEGAGGNDCASSFQDLFRR